MKTLLALLLLILAPMVSAAQTLTFTLETSTTDGQSVIPRLSWSTTPAAQGCTASGAWTGSKAATGVEVLPAVTTTKSYVLVCTWPGDTIATVSWTPPTTNTDGTPLTNLSGFRVLYGRTTGNLDQTVYLQDPLLREWRSPSLAAGDWFFTVLAFNAQGLEGAPWAPPIKKTLTASTNQTRTLELAIRFPNSPTAVTVR